MSAPRFTNRFAFTAAILISCVPTFASERVLRHSAIIEAPVEKVWNAFTTEEGVLNAWSVAKAKVDFRIGGTIQTSYHADREIGDPETTITHHIVSYEPQRMIAMRTDAPTGTMEAIKLICEHGWSVYRFEPLGPNRTRLSIAGMGYGEGPQWDEAYKFFESGNAMVMKHFQTVLADETSIASEDRIMDLVRSLCGGEWIYEKQRDDGTVFRARTRLYEILEGNFIMAEGWLGDQNGMWSHAHAVFGIEPGTGQPMCWEFMEGGMFVRAPLTLEGDKTLVYEWNMDRPDGASQKMDIRITMINSDEYIFQAFASPEDQKAGKKPMIEVTYKRVPSVPEVFTRMNPARAAGSAE